MTTPHPLVEQDTRTQLAFNANAAVSCLAAVADMAGSPGMRIMVIHAGLAAADKLLRQGQFVAARSAIAQLGQPVAALAKDLGVDLDRTGR